MSKKQLKIPSRYPIESSMYVREDGVIFTYTNYEWVKEK